MFGPPMFDIRDAAAIMQELGNCRNTFPNHYIRVTAFDSSQGVESIVVAFIVNRPQAEPGFRLIRHEDKGRTVRYCIESYAAQTHPEGARYQA
jgi:ribulose-bisphosphate carboxylase small chain